VAYDFISYLIIVMAFITSKNNYDIAPVFVVLVIIFSKLCEICKVLKAQGKEKGHSQGR
jgi:hypothetical protein